MRARSSLAGVLNDFVMMLAILLPVTSLEQQGKKVQIIMKLLIERGRDELRTHVFIRFVCVGNCFCLLVHYSGQQNYSKSWKGSSKCLTSYFEEGRSRMDN